MKIKFNHRQIHTDTYIPAAVFSERDVLSLRWVAIIRSRSGNHRAYETNKIYNWSRMTFLKKVLVLRFTYPNIAVEQASVNVLDDFSCLKTSITIKVDGISYLHAEIVLLVYCKISPAVWTYKLVGFKRKQVWPLRTACCDNWSKGILYHLFIHS